MKLAISGTYSSGKTLTVMALSHHTGVPRTLARAIREILPEAVPGKKLAECTPAEFLHLMMRRHVGRVEHETRLGDRFISDGSSLQEWLYGAARVRHGMNPSASADRPVDRQADHTAEMAFFAKVVDQFGVAMRQHVKATFDAYVHLVHELPISNDGHRPMNEDFRTTIDGMLLDTLRQLDIPYHEVSGTIEERLATIVRLHDLPVVLDVTEAVALAREEYARLDTRLETERARAAVA
jgi:hypothetical protein